MNVRDTNIYRERISNFTLMVSTGVFAPYATAYVHRGTEYCKGRSGISKASVARVMRAQVALLSAKAKQSE